MSLAPTLLLYNGNFYTQWPEMGRASAVAIRDGRIAAVGTDELRSLAGRETESIDLGGRFVMPGMTDSHIHFYNWAIGRREVRLAGARSLAEMQERIRARVARTPAGSWITGQGWNETEWVPPVMPTRHDLDILSTEHPMIFWRSDAHGAVANSAALALAGVDRDTPNPPGGVIGRDETGEPTGQLFELAIALVRAWLPDVSEMEGHETLVEAIRDCHRMGLLGIHDQRMKGHGEGKHALRAYARLRAFGELKLRVTTNIDSVERSKAFDLGLFSGLGDATLQLGHMKVFVDGSLGSQTAWMLEPFEGAPENYGVVVTPVEEIQQIVREAQQHGWAISVHAIGDRANREMLDIFEELVSERLPSTRLPHRIEHVQTIQPEDLPRLSRLGIVASVQPIHATDDMIAADRHWGERARNTYTFRQLLDAGTTLAFGSDAPVADPNPFVGIHSAVTRQRLDGTPPGGWHPQERISVEEAIAAYTLGAARAVGRAHEMGRIAPGYLADLIVLDRDLLSVSSTEIPDTRVEMVLFDGEVQLLEDDSD